MTSHTSQKGYNEKNAEGVEEKEPLGKGTVGGNIKWHNSHYGIEFPQKIKNTTIM